MNVELVAESVVQDFLSPEDEARAFWRLRYRLAATSLRQVLATARLRLALIVGLSVLLWLALFWLFADGFWFLRSGIGHPETHDQALRAVFGMFFAALMIMLIFSSGIILHGSLFHSSEIAFLLTVPARTPRVFLHKFQEAILFSSWGFLLLGSPMLLAYGIVAGAPWYYYAMLFPFILAFVYVPAGIGAVLCLCIMRWLPAQRVHVLILVGAALVIASVWFIWSLSVGRESDLLTPDWFQEMLSRLRFAEGRLLPSWWLSTGLLEASRSAWSQSVMFLVLLIANALFCQQLAAWIAQRIYRPAYSALYGRNVRRRRAKTARIDRVARRLGAFLPQQMQLLLVKDFRLFRRDAVQWSQFLIFFGLLVLYFLNIRRFSYDIRHIGWINMVAFLNLAVVGLLMSTFATRFVFPMVSLEGRRFWILGLMPVRRETILCEKFLFAVGGSMAPCAALILLSDVMLRVAPVVLASHQLTCLILCVGLSGIAVGLGARLPNFHEPSPARIAAGFGGTLSLIVSTLYILAVVLLTALPWHFYLAAQQTRRVVGDAEFASIGRWLTFWVLAGTAGSMVLGALATVLPLRIGFRAFRRLEF